MIFRQLSRIAVGLVLMAATAAAQGGLTTTAQVKLKKRPASNARVISLLAVGTNLETLSGSVKRGYIWVTDGIDSGWVFKRYTKKARTSSANSTSPSVRPGTSTSLAACPIEGRGKTGNIPSSSDVASNRRKRHF